MAHKFFQEREDQSEVKARIVQKYFYAWANVILPSCILHDSKLAYIDMFAGPGRYKDGSASTPLLVLKHAIEDNRLCDRLVVLLNDKDENHSKTLEEEIAKLDGINKLKTRPRISCGEVDADLAALFEKISLVPTFTFFDPFGYKGLSLKVVNSVIKDWGCDCVFFFNYNRINAAVTNPFVEQHMEALFGKERLERLQHDVAGKTPHQRQNLILEQLSRAIKDMGGKFVLPFTFKNEAGTRTTHSLIFVTKHFKGYEIMKSIMAKESSTNDQGVYTFEYSPADANTPLLFSLSRPLDYLETGLLATYKGETLTMREIYEHHSVDTPYIDKNYKTVLLKLEAEGKISADPTNRRKNTFADRVKVTFPEE